MTEKPTMTSTTQKINAVKTGPTPDRQLGHCHICLSKFDSVAEVQRHVVEAHDLRHGTARSYEKIMNSNEVENRMCS